MKTYSEHIAQVSTALADPTRREIMEHVLHSDSPLSVREVADHFGLHANAARMHLDKLVKGGLLKVVRRRGDHGGRPANIYDASDEDWELNLPPRRYKLLAEILARGISEREKASAGRMGQEAFSRGREEALANSSPLAHLPHGASLQDAAQAWRDEIRRQGHKSRMKNIGADRVEATFATCPFGESSSSHPGLVCEIHRRLEEGFLSTAGEYTLDATAKKCTFILQARGKKR